jgi:hypothetical protein
MVTSSLGQRPRISWQPKNPGAKSAIHCRVIHFIIGAELISTSCLRGRNQEMFGIRE